MALVKTTVQLDNDLVTDLKAEAHASGKSFRSVLNKALRKGMRSRAVKQPTRYVCPTSAMGKPLVADTRLDKALGLASDLEDAAVVAKLEQRK